MKVALIVLGVLLLVAMAIYVVPFTMLYLGAK